MDHPHRSQPLRLLTPRRPRGRRFLAAPVALATGAALCVGAALTGCSSSSSSKSTSAASSAVSAAQSVASQANSAAQSVASQAVSAGQSVGSAAASAAGSLGSAGSSALSSAQSAASSALAGASGGSDATSDVSLGQVAINADDHAQVPVTIVNHESQVQRYVVQVNFKDAADNLLDTVIVTVGGVQPNATGQVTATTNGPVSGTVTASVGSALRFG